MACSHVPAPPTLLIHVGSRRSANHRASCRRCCDSSLVNHSVSFWPCTQFGVRLGKVVGSWRLLVLEKKITRRPDVSYLTFTIFEDFSSVSAGQMEDAHGAERGNGRRDRWPNNVLFPLPPLSLPSSLFPVFFYTTCSLLFLRFVRDHCSLFWKSYTLADLSVCAKIPNGVPFRRYCRSVGFVYYWCVWVFFLFLSFLFACY